MALRGLQLLGTLAMIARSRHGASIALSTGFVQKANLCSGARRSLEGFVGNYGRNHNPFRIRGRWFCFSGLCSYAPQKRKLQEYSGMYGPKHLSRTQAAVCLPPYLIYRKSRCSCEFAQQSPPDSRRFFFRALISPYHQADSGTDPAVVRMGFAMLLDEAPKRRGRDTADNMFPAMVNLSTQTELDTYCEQDLCQTRKLPQYKGPEGVERWVSRFCNERASVVVAA